MAECIRVRNVPVEVEGFWLAERWWNTTLLFKLVKNFMFLKENLGDKLLLSSVKV